MLNSAANTTFRIEFFSNDSCDESGHGEGQNYLEAITVTTDASGNVSFVHTLSSTVPGLKQITATATDSSGNTSEFSKCREVKGPVRMVDDIIRSVDDLLVIDLINPGQHRSLTVKLDGAVAKIEDENYVAASNKLNAFDNQVDAFILGNILSAEEGEPLIVASDTVISLISH